MSPRRIKLLAIIGPGILVAATVAFIVLAVWFEVQKLVVSLTAPPG